MLIWDTAKKWRLTMHPRMTSRYRTAAFMRHTKQREQGGKKENGIGRNRELAQGDAQWSRSTLVPSRRQAKHRHRVVSCMFSDLPRCRTWIPKIPAGCPMTACLWYDLVLVLVDSITFEKMAKHPMVRAIQDASKVCKWLHLFSDFYSHTLSSTLARLIVPLKPWRENRK